MKRRRSTHIRSKDVLFTVVAHPLHLMLQFFHQMVGQFFFCIRHIIILDFVKVRKFTFLGHSELFVDLFSG
jgi:hypothetical protein